MVPGHLSDALQELGIRAAEEIARPESFKRMDHNERVFFGLGHALADLRNCSGIDPRLVAAEALEDDNFHSEATILRDAVGRI